MNIPAILRSSADPESVSLTVKSIVTLLVLWGFDASVVNAVGNEVVNIIVAGSMLISAVTALVGILRKINLRKLHG